MSDAPHSPGVDPVSADTLALLAKPTAGRTRVVFVAGAGRSGSTLLVRLLGELPEAFAAGELRYLWQRGLIEQRLCGCGRPVPTCPVWTQILGYAYPDLRSHDITGAATATDLLGRARCVPQLLRRPAGLRGAIESVTPMLASLYASIAATSGARIIIDSSKPPTYGWLLGAMPEIDLSVIHLVRDPRGTAHSWQRHKAAADRPTGGSMPRKSAWASAASWGFWNGATEALFASQRTPVLRVRYEDLIDRPESELATILSFIGSSSPAVPTLAGRRFAPGVTHTVAGNPSRIDPAPITLALDREWRHSLSPADRFIVTAAVAPLMHRYGYSLTLRD